MKPRNEDVRAFARRGWAENERAKRRFLADAYVRDPEAHFDSVCALREHLRLVRPEWPTVEETDRDLRDLIVWKEKIDRASSLARRRGPR